MDKVEVGVLVALMFIFLFFSFAIGSDHKEHGIVGDCEMTRISHVDEWKLVCERINP